MGKRRSNTIPGTKAGGAKAAATNKAKYGEDFYKRNGAIGGAVPTAKPKGFAAMSPEKRSEISRIGGRIGGLASPKKKGKHAAKAAKHVDTI